MSEDKRHISATQRVEISRRATRNAFIREMLYAGLLARLWPSYVVPVNPAYPNPEFPAMLIVHSPAGPLTWRLAADELPSFAHIEHRAAWSGEKLVDRTPTLLLLTAEGW